MEHGLEMAWQYDNEFALLSWLVDGDVVRLFQTMLSRQTE